MVYSILILNKKLKINFTLKFLNKHFMSNLKSKYKKKIKNRGKITKTKKSFTQIHYVCNK